MPGLKRSETSPLFFDTTNRAGAGLVSTGRPPPLVRLRNLPAFAPRGWPVGHKKKHSETSPTCAGFSALVRKQATRQHQVGQLAPHAAAKTCGSETSRFFRRADGGEDAAPPWLG